MQNYIKVAFHQDFHQFLLKRILYIAGKFADMTKEEKYLALVPKIHSLLSGEPDEVARMANIAAMLHGEFGFWWTGFYRTGDSELVLGPFQGPVACTRIPFGRGVCGTSYSRAETVIVPDVEKFDGHIACSSESRSEIVVPCRNHGRIGAVLDIDSRELDNFDSIDKKYLEKIASFLYDGTEREIWFAAGCFWGAQKFFKKVEGVVFTEVGFVNGRTQNPTYNEVYTDRTGHAECVHLRYEPEKVSLKKLVGLFLKVVDPFSVNKQGEDEGTRYRTGIYYEDERDFDIIEKEILSFEKEAGRNVAVEIEEMRCFYRAEEYHQDYLDKNPGGYCHLSPEIFKLAK